MAQRIYQLTCLITSELNQAELEDFSKKINSLIQEKGEIIKEETAKRIILVYPIQKKKGAFLCVFEIESEPEQINALKNDLEKEKNILRFIIIKKEIKKEKKIRRRKKVEIKGLVENYKAEPQ